ncbi:hypothetical protein N657DRAFT_677014 [Parathielavia appendiculata]|uniref:Helix-turn-helix domain-containing protein n=1 Tax=Parathielavia appendiculata TaxID=2587402 RepID=A0AAN6Z901_9PEZI|nr:hypothetical protein N657DRAFT_677014 [Parathielavia appendiculata]
MGASGSKAAQQTVRKFPSRAPGSSPTAAVASPATRSTPRSAPTPSADTRQRSQPQASYTKDDSTHADSEAADGPELRPDFAGRLQKMGIVQPNPIFSASSIASPFPDAYGIPHSLSNPQYPSSSSNATLSVLEMRRQIEARAKDELDNMGKSTDKGKEFLDIATVKQILVLQQGGASARDIESRLGLKPGVVARLGPQGIVTPAS